jgi:fatty acid desaturase
LDATKLTPADHTEPATSPADVISCIQLSDGQVAGELTGGGYSIELTEFLKRAKAKNLRAILDITLWGWGRISLGIGLFALFPGLVSYLIAILFVSSGMGILVALSHESQHSALLRSKKWNDLVGAWLCAYPVGSVYGASRAVHLAHHKYLNTSQDPDRHFHSEEDKATPEQFAKYFLKLLCGGQLWTSIIVNGFLRRATHDSASFQSEPVKSAPTSSESNGRARAHSEANISVASSMERIPSSPSAERRRKHPEILNLVPVQAVIFSLLWLATGLWWAYFALWLVPIFTLGTFLGYLRGFIDHARLESDDANRSSGRLISVPHPSLFDRALLTGLDFHFHAEHHFFPAVPHYYLPELHEVLQKEPAFRDRYLIRPTYFSFLRDYWRQISAKSRNQIR